MIIKYEKLLKNKNDLMDIDRTNPYNVVGALIHTINTYDVNNTDNFFDMLAFLMGDNQPISEMLKQNINDRMRQNNKYNFIGKSYFNGATNVNDYTPNTPYEIEVLDNPYTDQNEGYKRLLVKSGGSDNQRPVTVRLAKDGNYYVWSDTVVSLLADIKVPESDNPWA